MKLQQNGFSQIGVFVLAAGLVLATTAGFYTDKAKSFLEKGSKFYQEVSSFGKNFSINKKPTIALKEGDLCSIKPDWCGPGLKCEIVQQNTVVASQTGECRLAVPAVHGRVVFTWKNWDKVKAFGENTGVSLFEMQSFAKATDSGVQAPMNKYLEWLNRNSSYIFKLYFLPEKISPGASEAENPVDNFIEIFFETDGKFKISDMPSGKYGLVMTTPDMAVSPVYWQFQVNNSTTTKTTINLYGSAYNANNKINIVGFMSGLPLPSPPNF